MFRCWLGSGGGQPVDDGGARLVDLYTGDERADELPPLLPVEPIQAVLHPLGEVLKATSNRLQGHGLGELLFRLLQAPARLLKPGLDALRARGEFLQLKRPRLVSVEQTLETTLVAGEHSSSFVAASAPLGLHPIGRRPARPLLQDTVGILQDLPY